MSISKRHILMNAFLRSQFNYCLLVWTCHSGINNTKINRLNERCLRITYNYKTSSFENLLEKNGSVFIHSRNFHVPVTEMFKINKGILSSILKGIFERRVEYPYNVWCISQFSIPLLSTVFYGTESISFLGLKIWSLLPKNFKNIDSLENFKKLIKKWKHENCPCRLSKVYIKSVGISVERETLYYSPR